MFMMTNGMLLWWTLDNVPLPLLIKPKFVTEALQLCSERKCKLRQSNRNDKRIELKMQLLRSC